MKRKAAMAFCMLFCLSLLSSIIAYAVPETNLTKDTPTSSAVNSNIVIHEGTANQEKSNSEELGDSNDDSTYIESYDGLSAEIKNSKWFKLGLDEGLYKLSTEYELIGESYLGESIDGLLLMSEEIKDFDLKKFLGSSVCAAYTLEEFKEFKKSGMKTLIEVYEQVYLPQSSRARLAAAPRSNGAPVIGSTQWGKVTVTGSRMYENSDSPKLISALKNAGLINRLYVTMFNVRFSDFGGEFAWLNGRTFNSVGNSALLSGDISSFVRCLTPGAADPKPTMSASVEVRVTNHDEAGSKIKIEISSSPFGSGYQSIGGPIYLDYTYAAPPPKTGFVTVRKSSAKPDLTNGNSAYDLKGAKFSVWSCNSPFTYDDWVNYANTGANPKGIKWFDNFLTMPDGTVRRQVYVEDGSVLVDEPNIGSILVGQENGRNNYLYYERSTDKMELPVGNYGIIEEFVPGMYGYTVNNTVKHLTITENNTTTVGFTNVPTLDPIAVVVRKIDKETNLNKPPGSASLAGAEFTVKYYPVLTNNVNGLTPKYTWVITTDSDGYADIPDSQLPSVTYPNGVIRHGLPVGTLTIQETKAPTGYLIDNTVYLRQITVDGNGNSVVVTYNEPVVPEQVIRGGFKMQKVDKNTNQAKPQGNGSLSGATFTVTNISGQTVRVNGRDYANNAVCHTFTTDANGQYTSPANLLPYGNYRINETKASGGYLVNTGWSATVNIRTNGTIVDVTGNPVPEQVIRGGFKVQKVDKDTNGTTPQGNAMLQGAQLEVVNRSSQPVYTYMDGAWGMRQPNAVCYKITTGANGIAQSSADALPYGAYRIREAQSSSGYLINSGWYVDFAVSQNGAIADLTATRLQQQVIRGGFKAQKVDRDTNKNVPLGSGTLAGAELHVTNTSAHPVYTFMDGAWGLRQPNTVCCKIVTDENGTVQSSADALPYGSYRIKEVKAPEGYLPNTEWYRDFSITQDGIIHDITNTPVADQVIRGSLQLVKFREDSDKPIKTPLKGVEFTLTHKKTGEQVKIVTDENGYARTADNALVYGKWEVAETRAPAGYIPIQPFEINIERHNQIHYYIIENGTIRSAIRIIKTDKSTGNIIPFAGTEFRIRNVDKDEIVEFTTYYPNKETFTTIKTGADGTCFLPQMLEYGNYEAIEIKAPEGYMLNQTAVPFAVTGNSDYTNPIVVFVENEPAKGKIKLEKTGDIYKGYSEMEHDVAGKILLPVFEPGKLAGAEFEITAAEDIVTADGTVRATAGEVVDTIVTTDGEDLSKELYPGKYIIKENKAPEGYILDTTEYEVEITYQGGATEPTVTVQSVSNKWLEAKIEIDKEAQELLVKEDGDKVYTEINVKPGEGFLFTLNTAEQIRDIPKDAAVAYGFTNEEGKLVFEGKFPHGKYYVQELHTNSAYNHNDIKYPVDLTYSQDSVKIELSHKVVNELKKKEVTINKTDITGEKPVPGAVIEITDSNGNVVYRDVTDEDGQIKDIILVPGKYSFKETLSPDGYALNTAIMEFEVTDELEVVGDTTIKDEYTKIIFKKAGINDNPLPGAKFGLYKIDAVMVEKIDGSNSTDTVSELPENVIYQQKKTEEATYKETTYGQLIAEAISDENGIVTFEKIPFGNYLVKELEAPEGYHMTDKVYHFLVDGTYVNPTESVDTFINTRIMSIVKTDVSKSRFVPGSQIAVYSHGNEDEPIFKGTTDENGAVNNIPLLKPGEYTFVETAAPEGFAINEDTFKFTVDDKGKVSGQTDFYDDITKIKILKIDTNTKATLSGAKFGLYDENDTLIQEKVTDEQGIAEFSGMTFGRYSIKELEAPEGYKLSDRVITLIVNEFWVNEEPIDFDNGKLVVGRITGKYNSGEVDDGHTVNVKTGDSNRIWLLLLFSGISLICGLCFLLLKRKKRGEKSDISK